MDSIVNRRQTKSSFRSWVALSILLSRTVRHPPLYASGPVLMCFSSRFHGEMVPRELRYCSDGNEEEDCRMNRHILMTRLYHRNVRSLLKHRLKDVCGLPDETARPASRRVLQGARIDELHVDSRSAGRNGWEPMLPADWQNASTSFASCDRETRYWTRSLDDRHVTSCPFNLTSILSLLSMVLD